jgi:tetratricopeptide (TPR) repeat protein
MPGTALRCSPGVAAYCWRCGTGFPPQRRRAAGCARRHHDVVRMRHEGEHDVAGFGKSPLFAGAGSRLQVATRRSKSAGAVHAPGHGAPNPWRILSAARRGRSDDRSETRIARPGVGGVERPDTRASGCLDLSPIRRARPPIGRPTSLNNLACLLRAQGDFAAARPLYERTLAVREKALGPDHPDTATSLNNLAGLLRARGDLAAARPLYERALSIRGQALGPDHPDTARSLNNLAFLLRAQGDLAAARPLHERALTIRERALGPDHPDTLSSAAALADCLDRQGMALRPHISHGPASDTMRPVTPEREQE